MNMAHTSFGRQGPEVRILFPRPHKSAPNGPIQPASDLQTFAEESAPESGTRVQSPYSDVEGLRAAADALMWDEAPREQRFAKAIAQHGEHVIAFIGEQMPWDRLGKVAIETFQVPDGAVYFVGGDAGAVKIGITKRPLQRLANMQMGSPIPLRILALTHGWVSVEREYHKRFAAHRLHGEWFERCPEIEAEIDRLTSDAKGGHDG